MYFTRGGTNSNREILFLRCCMTYFLNANNLFNNTCFFNRHYLLLKALIAQKTFNF